MGMKDTLQYRFCDKTQLLMETINLQQNRIEIQLLVNNFVCLHSTNSSIQSKTMAGFQYPFC